MATLCACELLLVIVNGCVWARNRHIQNRNENLRRIIIYTICLNSINTNWIRYVIWPVCGCVCVDSVFRIQRNATDIIKKLRNHNGNNGIYTL